VLLSADVFELLVDEFFLPTLQDVALIMRTQSAKTTHEVLIMRYLSVVKCY